MSIDQKIQDLADALAVPTPTQTFPIEQLPAGVSVASYRRIYLVFRGTDFLNAFESESMALSATERLNTLGNSEKAHVLPVAMRLL